MFGIEHSGIEPDLITVAKSLAGGFPLSGVIGRADLMDKAAPGGLGGTYAGSPVSCAAARSEEHTSELQSLMRISYAVFCLKKKTTKLYHTNIDKQMQNYILYGRTQQHLSA